MDIDFDLDFDTIFNPQISGNLMDVYYSELMTKRENGIRLTEDIKNEIFNEVVTRFE